MEKPKLLYHGSPRSDIDVFIPKLSMGSGEKYGALVYATPDWATALTFTAQTRGVSRFGDVLYVRIREPREQFLEKQRGGYVYVLPGDTFSMEKGRGLNELEWASEVPVKPIRKIFIPSPLDAMIENGIRVYFINEDIDKRILDSDDHGYSIYKFLTTENEQRKK